MFTNLSCFTNFTNISGWLILYYTILYCYYTILYYDYNCVFAAIDHTFPPSIFYILKLSDEEAEGRRVGLDQYLSRVCGSLAINTRCVACSASAAAKIFV
jgi:hypothetical protein